MQRDCFSQDYEHLVVLFICIFNILKLQKVMKGFKLPLYPMQKRKWVMGAR